MKNILLISMPWLSASYPHLQIALLRGFLRQHKLSADVLHPYLSFDESIGRAWREHEESVPFFGEIVFSSLLYPEMHEISLAYIERFMRSHGNISLFSRSKMLSLFDAANNFIESLVKNTRFENYEYIGFSVIYHQLFSSIVLAQQIKESASHVKTVFGGYLSTGIMGASLMKAYPCIDYCISYEGELPLLYLLQGCHQPEDIPALTHRNREKVIINPPGNDFVDLDELPVPDFSEYFRELGKTKRRRFAQDPTTSPSLPVEGSRGCWWNKCTFCDLNTQCLKYREKSNARILKEIKSQVARYHIRDVYFVNNNIIRKDPRALFKSLEPLKLRVHAEYSASMRDFSLLQQLRRGGVIHLQFGIESLSKTLLEKKINKGARLIDNIQLLKWLRELNILSSGNLITGYPNETRKEFDEAINNMRALYHLEPPNLSGFALLYNSPIFKNPAAFNIRSVSTGRHYAYFIPPDILKILTLHRHSFTRKRYYTRPYRRLVAELNRWIQKFRTRSTSPLLYYRTTNDLVTITDARGSRVYNYDLDEDESRIYLFCHSVHSLKEISDICPHRFKKDIKTILDRFLKYRLAFREGTDYLSLAIHFDTHTYWLKQDGFKNVKTFRRS